MRAQDYADLYALEESLWWFVGMREVTRAVLDPLCPPGRRRDILDAGCGTGGMLTWLERYADGGRVAGVDISADALDFCRSRGLRDVARASVTALPFDAETFDLVTSFDVLVQLPGEGSDELAMREMFRVLRPGGLVVIEDSAQLSESPQLGNVLRGFPREFHEPFYADYLEDDLADMLREVGFAIESSEPQFVAKVVAARRP